MKDLIERITRVPWVAHLLHANERFTARLGNQFTAAITYFSVLAVVPILMLALSILGLALTQVPALRQSVTESIAGVLRAAPGNLSDQSTTLMNTYLDNFAAIGIVGLLSAMYAGAGWIGNLKSAVRTQWKPDFDLVEDKRNLVLETLVNLAILLGLLVLVGATGVLSSVATALSTLVGSLLGLDRIPGGIVLVRLAPVVISIAVGWVLFMFLFKILPQDPIARRSRMKGSLIAAIGLVVLQFVTGILFGVFTKNAAAAIFGPVIVLMLFLNLFARLILFMAAWIATSEQPALGSEAGTPELAGEAAISGPPEGPQLPPRLRSGDPVAARAAATPVDGQTGWTPGEGQDYVPQKVAVRSVRIGMGAGYVTGTATGIGVGAVVAVVVGKVVGAITGRRKRRDS